MRLRGTELQRAEYMRTHLEGAILDGATAGVAGAEEGEAVAGADRLVVVHVTEAVGVAAVCEIHACHLMASCRTLAVIIKPC